jgi:hypothetical protein
MTGRTRRAALRGRAPHSTDKDVSGGAPGRAFPSDAVERSA